MAEGRVKLLHTADLHLDSPLKSLALRHEGLAETVATASRTSLERIVSAAVDEGVAAVLIAGDLFDGAQRSAETAAFLVRELDRLGAAGIEVFVIRGNHDAITPVTGAFDMPSNVHVFDGHGGSREVAGTDIWIHGVSFRDRHAPESLLPKFPPPVAGAVNIGLLHTSLVGAAGHDPYAPCTVAELAAHGYDYWALGHVHARAVHATDPFIVMPGNPQGRDIGEEGPKTATLIEVEDGRLSISEVPTSTVEFRRLAVDVTDAEDEEALRALLRQSLREAAAATTSDAAILRLTLTGASPQAWQIRRLRDHWQTVAERLAEETGSLWIEQLATEVLPPAAAGASDAAAELTALMAGILDEPGFQAEALAIVETLRSLLPPGRRQDLAKDPEALERLAAQLARDGADELSARLRGAGT